MHVDQFNVSVNSLLSQHYDNESNVKECNPVSSQIKRNLHIVSKDAHKFN